MALRYSGLHRSLDERQLVHVQSLPGRHQRLRRVRTIEGYAGGNILPAAVLDLPWTHLSVVWTVTISAGADKTSVKIPNFVTDFLPHIKEQLQVGKCLPLYSMLFPNMQIVFQTHTHEF